MCGHDYDKCEMGGADLTSRIALREVKGMGVGIFSKYN